MRKIHGHTATIVISCFLALYLVPNIAFAQAATVNNNQNFGFNLPTPPVSGGFDEVKAADGTTCRSSISGNGPYLDFGGISSPPTQTSNSDLLAYGRIIIPLGKKPGRIDCTSLYQLEIDRLKHELKLAKSGFGSGDIETDENADWQNSGWNNNGEEKDDTGPEE